MSTESKFIEMARLQAEGMMNSTSRYGYAQLGQVSSTMRNQLALGAAQDPYQAWLNRRQEMRMTSVRLREDVQ